MNRVLTPVVLFFFTMVLFLSGCSGGEEGSKSSKGEVELVYVLWADSIASTNVMKVVLEDMGYEVKLTSVSAAAMWQGVATGAADGMVAAWLPTTHSHYREATEGKVVNLGPNLEGTQIGLVVPAYMPVDSIEDLKQYSDRLDGKIIGIDPGAGIMDKTKKAMEAYGLDEFKLVQSSDAAMVGALGGAIRNKEWIVVTGWIPHWKFARWDLKFLEDPRGVYGGKEHIDTVVRQGLKEDMPEVYSVLDRFQWSVDDVNELMSWNQQDRADPYENARRWVKEHPEKVKAWTGE